MEAIDYIVDLCSLTQNEVEKEARKLEKPRKVKKETGFKRV